VYRNPGNMVACDDLNCSAVIQYAVNDENDRLDALCEINVHMQVRNVSNSPISLDLS